MTARFEPEPRSGFRLGEFRIEPGANEIGGTRVDTKAMNVLVALADAAPRVVSASALLDRVWADVVVGDNVVHQAIAHLRAALGDRAREPRFIEHVPRRGYRLIAPVEPIDPRGSDGAHAAAPSTPPHNLPAQLTSFVGRAVELQQVRNLLDAHRLVTITGVGGAGKTRLALEVAAGVVSHFRDGVWFVELAALTDPSLIGQAIVKTLHIPEAPGHATDDALLAVLSSKRALLVLDNCEHLIDACARTIDGLLRHAPDLKVLATSREALGIAGEHSWRIASLAFPSPEHLPPLNELGEIESVRLLVERGQEVQPAFVVTPQNSKAIAQICERLDGIPLAIELAAARLRALTPEQICTRLDDRFRLLTGGSRTAVPRQQTLQATFDWSHALLDPLEQVLLRRLAVFVGGWTLEAAEAVAGDEPLAPSAIVDLLTHLLDKSWLQVTSSGEPRYRMLETVRQYANARLLDAGEGELMRDRHRDYFCEMAQRTAGELSSGDQRAALALFDAEHDNLRAALAWCTKGDAEAGLRLASSLWRYWMTRGLATSGRPALEDLLARVPETAQTTASRASALLGAGWMARFQGDYDAARRQLTQSIELFAALGDRAREAEALSNLASNLIYTGEADEGERVAAQALELARAAADPFVIGNCLQTFGDQLANRGDFARARELLDEGVAVLRTLGDAPNLPFALAKLGYLLLQQGELPAARAALEEAQTLHERLGEGHGIDHTLLRLGWLAHHEGNDAQAVSLLERSQTIAEQAGFVPEAAMAQSMLGRLALQRGEADRAAELLTDGLARAERVQAHDAYANCVEGLAMLALHHHDASRAARLLGAAERIREGAGRPLAPIEQPEYRRVVRALRAALKKAEFAAAWKRGRAMTPQEMTAEMRNNQREAPENAS